MINDRHDVVKLRTGVEAHAPLVTSISLTLDTLLETNPVALFELATLAEDPGHVPFGNSGEVLQRYGLLLGDGRMHDSIRDIVRASIEGKDLEMHLVSPVATEAVS